MICDGLTIFHSWDVEGRCRRCGIRTGSSSIRGMQRDERWEVAQSESAVLGSSRPVDRQFRSDSSRDPERAYVESPLAAMSPEEREEFLDALPPFLRPQGHGS